MYLNKTSAIGNVKTKTPKVLTLAIPPATRKGKTLTLTIRAKGATHDVMQKYISVGDRLYVEGQLDAKLPHTLNLGQVIMLGTEKKPGKVWKL